MSKLDSELCNVNGPDSSSLLVVNHSDRKSVGVLQRQWFKYLRHTDRTHKEKKKSLLISRISTVQRDS
jgi:hypothetical protein